MPDAVLRYRFRDTLSGIVAQARSGGVAEVRLYALHRAHGARPGLVRVEVRKGARALARLARARSVGERAAALHRLGLVIGHVEGAVRLRVPYLRWRLPPALRGAAAGGS